MDVYMGTLLAVVIFIMSFVSLSVVDTDLWWLYLNGVVISGGYLIFKYYKYRV